MVIKDDWSPEDRQKKKKKKVLERPAFPLALPFDRLTANIADCVIFLPLVSVALAVLRKQMTLSQLVGTEPELHAYAVFYTLSVVLMGWLYQVFFLTTVGATPGKFFFGLRVWDVWTKKKPHWQKVFIRSALWWIDLVLVLPLLSVFFDCHRRPLHDRLSDTVVVNQRDRHAGLPTAFESGLARIFFIAMVSTFGYFIFSQSWQGYNNSGKLGISLKRWAGGTPFCSEVDDAIKVWPAKSDNHKQRLTVAMALFASGDIDEACLDFEADALIWQQGLGDKDHAFAYLAKAFSQIESGEESNQYLDKVCELAPSSDSCDVIGLIEHFQNGKSSSEDITKKVLENVPDEYVKVWLIRYYYKKGRLEEVDQLISALSLNTSLAKFLSEFRVKSLWRQGRHEVARSSFELYWENSAKTGNTGLGWWLCDQELLRDCSSAGSASCRVFDQKYNEIKSTSYEVLADLTLYRKKECEGELVPTMPDGVPTELLSYVDQVERQISIQESVENLLRISEHRQYSIKIRQDAALRAIQLAGEFDQLEPFLSFWLGLGDMKWSWYVVGENLYTRMISWKRYQQAARVADRLSSWRASPENLRRRAVAYALSGKEKKAWSLVRKAEGGERNKRGPASLKEAEKVLRRLKQKYGGQ